MYNTKSKFLAISLIITLLLSACVFAQDTGIEGSGVVVEETRELSGVKNVRLTMDAHLTLTVGDTESLTYEGEDNLLAYILSDVDNGVLTIQNRPRIELNATKPINFYLTVKELDSIEVTSSGDVEISDVETDTFEVKISGSGSVDIAGGKVKSQTVKITSSGNYNAEDLESDEADVKITSSGSATIWVNNKLTVEVRDSGEVRYKGNPSVEESSKSSGEVIQIGD